MRKKYTLSLAIIICTFLLCVLILLQYNAYLSRQEKIGGVTYVNGDLSVNYLNGKAYSDQDVMEFSVTNQSTETLYYYVHLINVSGSLEEVSYELTSTIEEQVPISSNFTKTVLISREAIEPNETERFTLKMNNSNHKDIHFEIDTDLDEMDQSFANTILANNTVQEADAQSGLIGKLEQYGEIYYFKGNVPNNYVSFGGLTWRIVKINEDKTVKLILNDTTQEFAKMKETSNEEPFHFNESTISEHLANWYQVYLENVDEQIVSTLYCFDDSIISDENNRMEYLSNVRIFDEQIPTNACGGTTISNKIALLTADEVMFAGGSQNENKDYYLYLNSLQSSWWTMTPNKKENNVLSYMAVKPNGAIERDINETTNLFIRPVITLTKKVEAIGSGTLDNPYLIQPR